MIRLLFELSHAFFLFLRWWRCPGHVYPVDVQGPVRCLYCGHPTMQKVTARAIDPVFVSFDHANQPPGAAVFMFREDCDGTLHAIAFEAER